MNRPTLEGLYGRDELRSPPADEELAAHAREIEEEAVLAADDYVDQASMDSFPASDPPSWTPTALGQPSRARPRGSTPAPSAAGATATRVALLRSLGTLVASAARLARAWAALACARLIGRVARHRPA